MDEYKKPYLALWKRLDDIAGAIEQQNYGTALEYIRKAQMEAEEVYIEEKSGQEI